MTRLIRFWADIDAPVGRATYLANGVGLAAIKYLGGGALIWRATGAFPTPLDYWLSLHMIHRIHRRVLDHITDQVESLQAH